MAEMITDVPAMLALWDHDKNDADPATETARSYRTVWWKCDKDHSFQRKPRMMHSDPACPTCALGSTSLADSHPALAARWHTEKNSTSPSALSASHSASAWWSCDKGHAFQRSPLQMVSDDSCPHCALASHSLAARFPQIAAEWHPHKNGDVRPDQVEPDHKMSVWWLCNKSHEFRASVRSRTKGGGTGGRCPHCYGAWTLDSIRSFVQSLLGHIDAFTPSEMFALAMQAGALRGKSSQAFVKALTTGRFPVEELQKFAEGKPSLVDDFAGDAELTLEMVEGKVYDDPREAVAAIPDDPFALPARPDADFEDDTGEIDVSVEVEAAAAVSMTSGAAGASLEEGDDLPLVQTREALAALDTAFIANADAETVKFLLDSAEAKLWRHATTIPRKPNDKPASSRGTPTRPSSAIASSRPTTRPSRWCSPKVTRFVRPQRARSAART